MSRRSILILRCTLAVIVFLGGLALFASSFHPSPAPPSAPDISAPTNATDSMLRAAGFLPVASHIDESGERVFTYLVPVEGHDFSDMELHYPILATDDLPAVDVVDGKIVRVIGPGNNPQWVTIVEVTGHWQNFGALKQPDQTKVLRLIKPAREWITSFRGKIIGGWAPTAIGITWAFLTRD